MNPGRRGAQRDAAANARVRDEWRGQVGEGVEAADPETLASERRLAEPREAMRDAV
jgi:hypothetical protein